MRGTPMGSGKHTHLNGGMGLKNSASPGTYETGWNSPDWNAYVDIADLPDGGAISWSWTPSPEGNENLPINSLGWYASYAFCIWDGGFLPSEAEWEYAAAGGGEQRKYPWGSTDPGTSNQYAIYGCFYNRLGPVTQCRRAGDCSGGNIAAVGTATLGAGLWGQLDLAGNVYEWTLDTSPIYVGPCVYPSYPNPCVDCFNFAPSSIPIWITRGGFACSDGADLLPTHRDGLQASTLRSIAPGDFNGFRCARTP
jgi:formylglycine-generating enzyme required for sulfatase activity